jgi:hypothetical protein
VNLISLEGEILKLAKHFVNLISLEGEILKLAKHFVNLISLEGEILKLAKPFVNLISLEGEILKLAKPVVNSRICPPFTGITARRLAIISLLTHDSSLLRKLRNADVHCETMVHLKPITMSILYTSSMNNE